MARERYLIGVDPEELKAPPPPPEKKTGFFENLWYHYKWHLLIGGFVLLLLTLAVITMVTKDDPDYTVVLLTGDPLTSETVTALQDQLAAVGEDVDGDGKVEVLIENLALGIAYSNQKIANDNTFMAHLASGDVLLFAAEPAYYDKKIASLSEDGSSFFAPLSNGDTYVRWHPGRQDVSEELYIGVRPATGTAKQNQSYEQCRRLLEQLMAQN